MPNFRDLQTQLLYVSSVTRELEAVVAKDAELTQRTKRAITKTQESQALNHLMALPVEALRSATDETLRIEPLRKSGVTSVGAVYLASTEQLERLSGVSSEGAAELKSVAQSMFHATTDAETVAFDIDSLNANDVDLLESLKSVGSIRSSMHGKFGELDPLVSQLQTALESAHLVRSRIRWFFSSPERKRQVLNALASSVALLEQPEVAATISLARKALTELERSAVTSAADDFRARSAEYYALLEQVTGIGPRLEHAHFDQALLDRIESAPLDTSRIRATMRRYQVFGSQFALSQGRVILGDEMGLGKTLQALAALSQRSAEGAQRFLVVCPATVLVNWQREIETHSELTFVSLHGKSLESGLDQWRRSAGIALTTFDTLKAITLSDDEISALGVDTVVVDEAHYIKNSDAGRTKAASRWLLRAPRALLLTGTPMENRVEEFITLASMLDAQFANGLNHAALAVGAHAFRRQVAPIYLRRNTEDVLKELPSLVQTDEYCDWTGADHAAYVQAADARNLMGMRKAGMMPRFPGVVPNKLERVLELCDEAFASGRKVLIFSYFRDVLDLVVSHLGNRALGPITGDLSPARRQELVDEFTASAAPLALVGQVQAAGTGLNVQAASVVILCEPQIKPSLEVQAIARAHRMGQVHSVQVHRLVIPDSVDELMVNLVARKQDEFDAYARESELADATSAATDRSEESLAKVILLAERRRLGIEAQPTN